MLDFARDRAAIHHRRRLVWGALGLVFGLQLGLAAWRLQSAETKLASLESTHRQLLGKGARTARAELSAGQLKAAQTAQTMLSSLAVPWEDLFGAVERASTHRVLIDSIQPRAENGSVNISVSSANFADTAEFMQRLTREGTLHGVMLASESQPEGNTSPMRAVISANWSKPK